MAYDDLKKLFPQDPMRDLMEEQRRLREMMEPASERMTRQFESYKIPESASERMTRQLESYKIPESASERMTRQLESYKIPESASERMTRQFESYKIPELASAALETLGSSSMLAAQGIAAPLADSYMAAQRLVAPLADVLAASQRLNIFGEFEKALAPFKDTSGELTKNYSIDSELAGFRALLETHETWRQSVDVAATQVQEIDIDLFRKFENTAIEPLASALFHASRDLDASRKFTQTPLGQILRNAAAIHSEAGTSAEEIDSRLEAIKIAIKQLVLQVRRKKIPVQFLMSVVLTVFLFIWDQLGAKKAEERNLANQAAIQANQTAIRRAQVETIEAIEELHSEIDQDQLYVVRRNSTLKSDPSEEHSSATYLTQGTVVSISGQQDDWSLVDVFEISRGETVRGWIQTDHLRPHSEGVE
jgi:hypothetical protein